MGTISISGLFSFFPFSHSLSSARCDVLPTHQHQRNSFMPEPVKPFKHITIRRARQLDASRVRKLTPEHCNPVHSLRWWWRRSLELRFFFFSHTHSKKSRKRDLRRTPTKLTNKYLFIFYFLQLQNVGRNLLRMSIDARTYQNFPT